MSEKMVPLRHPAALSWPKDSRVPQLALHVDWIGNEGRDEVAWFEPLPHQVRQIAEGGRIEVRRTEHAFEVTVLPRHGEVKIG